LDLRSVFGWFVVALPSLPIAYGLDRIACGQQKSARRLSLVRAALLWLDVSLIVVIAGVAAENFLPLVAVWLIANLILIPSLFVIFGRQQPSTVQPSLAIKISLRTARRLVVFEAAFLVLGVAALVALGALPPYAMLLLLIPGSALLVIQILKP